MQGRYEKKVDTERLQRPVVAEWSFPTETEFLSSCRRPGWHTSMYATAAMDTLLRTSRLQLSCGESRLYRLAIYVSYFAVGRVLTDFAVDTRRLSRETSHVVASLPLVKNPACMVAAVCDTPPYKQMARTRLGHGTSIGSGRGSSRGAGQSSW